MKAIKFLIKSIFVAVFAALLAQSVRADPFDMMNPNGLFQQQMRANQETMYRAALGDNQPREKKVEAAPEECGRKRNGDGSINFSVGYEPTEYCQQLRAADEAIDEANKKRFLAYFIICAIGTAIGAVFISVFNEWCGHGS